MITDSADEYMPAYSDDESENSDHDHNSASQTQASKDRIVAPSKNPKIDQARLGLAHSMHASSSHEYRTPTHNRENVSSYVRAVPSPSAAVTNEFATALLAWQNAGSEYLRSLPPTIAADLRAIVTRSAARVIAGLPVFENGPMNQQP